MKERSVVVVGVLALFVTLFFPVLFQGRQFSYRDAAHFYYPLFEHIQDQWQSGRVPLWNPYENSGAPLLANPTSSVLYPGKAVFFLPISYAAAYRAYILLHVLLCAATAFGMARHWGAGVPGAGLCGVSYAFCGTVLIQHANVVFLVGAAWIPLALVCADKALRLGRWTGAVGLGVVLALEVLGGDPQAAYLCGTLAAFYALGLFVADRRAQRVDSDALDTAQSHRYPKRVVMLAAAAVLGLLLALAQVVPTWQLTRRSGRAFHELPRTLWELPIAWLNQIVFNGSRAGAGPAGNYALYDTILGAGPPTPHNIYDFSTEPWRWAELIWPNVSGRQFPRNSRWTSGLPDAQAIWTPSLYMGLFPLVLALTALGFRRVSGPRRWLSAMVLFGLLGSLGSFGLVWAVRLIAGEGLAGRAGDEVGGPYWLVTVLLPGFVNFRYPSKLLVFAALGLSGLAAVGWDRLAAGNDKAVRRLLLGLSVLSGAGLLLTLAASHRLDDWLAQVAARATDAHYGPLDVREARLSIQGAMLQSTLVALAALWLIGLVRGTTARRWVPAALLLLTIADLAVANRWMVQTVPQSVFERTPHALEIIEEDNLSGENPGEPYRIFRPGILTPVAWFVEGSDERPEQGLRWFRDTLTPKYGLAYGVEDADVLGTMTLYDYEFFFGTWREDGAIRYPRYSFDLWNVKYFILPAVFTPQMLADEYRASVQLAGTPGTGNEATLLYEPPPERRREIDYQIVRNPSYLPRAWLVHNVKPIPPVVGFRKADRTRIIEPIVVRGKHDLRRTALVETDDRAALARLNHPEADAGADRCRFLVREPDRVELEVEASVPSLLVVSETYYPEWRARVDGQPAPILRTNRMMRGVAVPAGTSRVTFSYEPTSFWASAAVSAMAWALLLVGTGVWTWRRRKRTN